MTKLPRQFLPSKASELFGIFMTSNSDPGAEKSKEPIDQGRAVSGPPSKYDLSLCYLSDNYAEQHPIMLPLSDTCLPFGIWSWV